MRVLLAAPALPLEESRNASIDQLRHRTKHPHWPLPQCHPQTRSHAAGAALQGSSLCLCSVRAGHDLNQLGGDHRLPLPVELEGQLLLELLRIVAGAVHGVHAGSQLGRQGLLCSGHTPVARLHHTLPGAGRSMPVHSSAALVPPAEDPKHTPGAPAAHAAGCWTGTGAAGRPESGWAPARK